MELGLISKLHNATERKYTRGIKTRKGKAFAMRVARQYGYDYFDGERRFGYGGYVYDGRFKPLAKKLIKKYKLNKKSKVLDVGCGKGFLVYELKQLGIDCIGIDSSEYAKDNSHDGIEILKKHNVKHNEFDLVICMGMLHSLSLNKLEDYIKTFSRASKHQYITVDSYRNEQELVNLQTWALTCEQFFTPEEWEFLFKEWGYDGDYDFLYFK